MEQNITIRNANRTDISKIMDIERECFDNDTIESESVYIERIDKFNDGFLVLTNNDTVIGFICSEIWTQCDNLNENSFKLEHSISETLDLNGKVLYISSLAISKQYTGYGYGKTLFNFLIESVTSKYNNIKEIILLVGSEWKNAHQLYKKEGFEDVREFVNFFGGGNVSKYNGIIMKKRIK